MFSTMLATELRSSFPHRVTVSDHWIELSDGCRLFARAVLPAGAARRPVPAVLEYLPYRLTDGTAHGDALHHGWAASQAITSAPSICSWGRYSSRRIPPELPVPRMSTRTEA